MIRAREGVKKLGGCGLLFPKLHVLMLQLVLSKNLFISNSICNSLGDNILLVSVFLSYDAEV